MAARSLHPLASGLVTLSLGLGVGLLISPAAQAEPVDAANATNATIRTEQPCPPPATDANAATTVNPPSLCQTSEPAPSGTTAQTPSQSVDLPFSDVPPDHWAYDALLYLSTGGRRDQASTAPNP